MRKRQILLLLTLAIITAVLVSFAYHYTQKDKISFHLAEGLFKEGRYEEAIPFYLEAMREGMEEDKLILPLAYSYLWTEAPEESAKVLEEIRRKDALDLSGKKALAEAYSRTNRLSEAIEIYEEHIVQEADISSKKELIRLYLWNDDLEEAKRTIRPLIDRYPEDGELNVLWAQTLYFSGESEKASEVLEMFLKGKK